MRSRIFSNNSWFPWLLGGAAYAGIGLVTVILPPMFSLAIIALICLFLVLLFKSEWLLVILLLVRSSADLAQDLFVLFPGNWYSFNAAGLLNILGVGVGLILLARRYARGQPLLPSASLKLFCLFLLVAGLGISGSVEKGVSIKEWSRLAGYLGIALLALEVANKGSSIRNILRIITLAAVPPLVLGYYQAMTGRGYYFPGYSGTSFAFRPLGTFGHPAILAAFLVFIICLVSVAYLWKYPIWPRPVILGIGILSMGLLVLTYARTEWLGCLVALATIALFRYRRLFLIGPFLILVVFVAFPTVQERLQGQQAGESFEWRLEVWDAAQKILRPPKLIGTGLDTFSILINKLLPRVSSPPHNDYLKLLVETGIIGFFIYLVLQLSLLRQFWDAYCHRETLERKVLGLTMFAMVIGGLVISLADNYLSFVSVQWYSWIIVGFLSHPVVSNKTSVNLQFVNK